MKKHSVVGCKANDNDCDNNDLFGLQVTFVWLGAHVIVGGSNAGMKLFACSMSFLLLTQKRFSHSKDLTLFSFPQNEE